VPGCGSRERLGDVKNEDAEDGGEPVEVPTVEQVESCAGSMKDCNCEDGRA
jgi:hypothetical protein